MNRERENVEQTVTDNISENDNSYNLFYHNTSVLFRIMSFVLFAAFLVFIVSSAFAGAEEFSYENLEYIVRNFALKLDENRDASLYSVTYNPDANRSFGLFGKGLAVCGSTQLSIFSATGRLTCNEAVTYKEPVMTLSDKFVLVYDSGNTQYTVYNSFTDVYSAQMKYPIRAAAIANNGSHAVVTSSDAYNSVVEVYNANYQRTNAINSTGYVSAVDISDDHVLVASLNIGSSNSFVSKLLYCAIGADKAEFEIELDGGFPLACEITEHGFTVICNDSVLFYDAEGELSGKYEFQDALEDFRIDGSGVALLFKKSGFDIQYSVVCVGTDGRHMFDIEFDKTVADMEFSDGVVYVLSDGMLVAFNGEDTANVPVSGTDNDSVILIYGDLSVYVCNRTAAPLIKIEFD
ncbi:MAG: DUF5711 family protein [Eubacteriales bacterium]